MKRYVLLAVLLFMAVGVSGAETVDTASLLQGLYDLSALPVLTNSQCRQFSSYDRSGGNGDAGNFLSRSADGTVVLAEMKGPGAVVRIWSANPSGILKVFLDDAAEPVIVMPFKDFFADPLYQPIRTTSSGGFISYYPIPYAKSCRVTAEKPESTMYYHVTYQTYGLGTEVKTYAKGLDSLASENFGTALKVWRAPAGSLELPSKTSVIPAGKTLQVFAAKGAGRIEEFVVTTEADPRTLRQAVIRMYWDGERSPSVEAPLLDFFGNGFENAQYDSLPIGGRWGIRYCRFPMPYARGARIEIENGSAQPLDLKVGVSSRKLESLGANTGRFHAKWNRAVTKAGEPYLILRARGRGRLVGASLTMQGDRGIGFLEGDELIYVDGEKQPSFNGTGTEDYFNSGWYFSGGLTAQPLHGVTFKDPQFSSVAAYRFHIPDHVDYRRELVFAIEHGGMSDYPGAEYSSVAYFYSMEPHLDFFKMPAAKDIALPRKPVSGLVPPTRATRGTPWTFEAEGLQTKAQGGDMETLSWEQISRDWWGGKVVTLTPKDRSAALTVPFEVEFRDRYAIAAWLVRGRAFGPVAAEVDGRRLPGSPNMFLDREPVPAGNVEFGEVLLDPGKHILKLIPLGTEDGLPKIGLDRIELVSCSPFISSWYLIGPFDNQFNNGLDTPFPPETEVFNPAAAYAGKGGKQIAWQEIDVPGLIYIQDVITPNTQAVAYAFTHVISPDERENELMLGSDDSVKVWLNGQEIWRNKVGRSVVADNDRVKVTLKPGVNTLLFKIVQSGGRWGYVARLRNPDGDLKYSAKAP